MPPSNRAALGDAGRSGMRTPPPEEMGMLAEAEQLTLGGEYWMEDEKGAEVWAMVEVLEQCEGHVTVRVIDSNTRKELDLDLEEMFPKNPTVVADMTALHHIHEPGILHNLKERSRPWRQTPYTFMGTILLAVNPLKAVPTPSVENYMDVPLDPEQPHPYAIAELSYRQMRMAGGRAGTNQSIVVSGESGAGKTETVKIILSYLARRSSGADEDLEAKVLESSPILESFGNARTLRNDNSSRFGKFLKLLFTNGEFSYLLGASVEPYLLEKSRVLAQGEGERNFHILYELVAGALQSGLAKELKLENASNYRILSASGCISLEGVDDADRFKAIQEAFTTVGVDSNSQMQVWQALSAILHLSTVSFHEADREEGPVAAISNKGTLATAASLLGLQEQALEDMLTLKVVPVTRGEVFTKHLGVKDSVRARDAAVKSLYESIFLWVVRAINLSLGGTKVAGDDKLPFIGLLDIFGFENFGHRNNLEQLLINYANESLQGDFNRQVFENELRVYAEEGIDVTVSAAIYTSSCLRMLTGKRDGVLPILDDVCSQPLPTDKRYLERLHVAFTRRQGQGMDVTVKTGSRDVISRRSSFYGGSDDGSTSVASRKWGGSDVGGSSGNSTGDSSTDFSALEWLMKGSIQSSDSRTEQHESFWVNHYASKVLYTVDGWVERNMDSVPQSFSDTMMSSDHQVVFDASMEYSSEKTESADKDKKISLGALGDVPIPRKLGSRRDNKVALNRRTVAGNFMASMQNLSATLAGTTCGFVRCIKPNAAMDFGVFDSHYVVEQLRCLGVLRTCEVLKMGMPTRVSYQDLKQSLGDGILEAEKMFEGEPEKSLVAAILWAFDIPSEAFRLGAKRVFFRAGQIAVLHKILNETPPDKVPWILSRLRLALANRRMAKIAAEEAEDLLAEAEASVMEAEAVSTDSGRMSGASSNSSAPLSPGASADADMRALVATIEKARRAAQNASQLKAVLKTARSEGVGEHAKGASDKIKTASEAALADIAKATARAKELEELTTLGVFGADGASGETSAVRELHIAMRDIRDGLASAQKMWKSAEEAADKCEAQTAVERATEAKAKAALVVDKSKKVAATSKKAIDIARKQRKTKDVTVRATEKALRSFRSFQVVARQATLEEKRARENCTVETKKPTSLPFSATPGRGLVAAAKAALPPSVAYEALTEAQKQKRAEGQKAASAEAAKAIAAASKEEEKKRLELAALELERLQELEEEAAAATEEGEREGKLKEVAMALAAAEAATESAEAAQVEAAQAEAAEVVAIEAEAAETEAQRIEAARAETARAEAVKIEAARAEAVKAEAAREEAARAEADASKPKSSKVAMAAVEAVNGVRPFAGGAGAAEAEAKEEAAAAAEGRSDGDASGDSGQHAAPSTSGWGENSDQNGPGSVKGRFVPFTRNGDSGGRGSKPGGVGRGKEDGTVGSQPSSFSGRVSGDDVDENTSSEGVRRVSNASGWGNGGEQAGPGSVKGRPGAFTGNGDDSRGPANAPGGKTSPPGRRSIHDMVLGDGSDEAPSSEAGHRLRNNSGWGPGGGQTGPGSVKSRLGAFTGNDSNANGSSAPGGVGRTNSTGGRSSSFRRLGSGEKLSDANAGGGGGIRSPPYLRGGSGGSSGDTASDAGVGRGETANGRPSRFHRRSNSGDGAPRNGGDGVRSETGWGHGGHQAGPGSVKGRAGAFAGNANGSANGDGERVSPPGSRRSTSIHDRVLGDGSEESPSRESDGHRLRNNSGWGAGGDKTGPGSVKGRLGAFTGNDSSNSNNRGETGFAANRSSSSSFKGAYAGDDADESSSGESGRGARNSSGWAATNGRKALGGSVNDRLRAFSGDNNKAPSGPGGPHGSRSPPFHRAGSPDNRGDAGTTKVAGIAGNRSLAFRGLSRAGSSGSSRSSINGKSPPHHPGGGGSLGSARSSPSGGIRARGGSADMSSGASQQGGNSSATARREKAIAGVALAKAAAAREEEAWSRKAGVPGGDRRKGRWDGAETAPRGDEEDGGGSSESGSASGDPSRVGVRSRVRRPGADGTHRAELKSGEGEWGTDYADHRQRRGGSGEESVPPLARTMNAGKPRKRSMKKSSFLYDSGDGAGDEGEAVRDPAEHGGGSSRGVAFAGGDAEDDKKVQPWPEAAMADGGEDEEGETVEAKKPLNGWDASPGMVPWRSPERAPEYGGNGSGGPAGAGAYVRSTSFAGDPSHGRKAPWDKGDGAVLMRNHSMGEEIGHQEEAVVSWNANPKSGEEAVEPLPPGSKPIILESMLFKDDAKEVGVVEARVMSFNSDNKSGRPPRRAPTWTQYYFRLREGVLTKSPPRRSSFPGSSQKSEDMELTSGTITSYTNTKNCFCVRTDDVSWFLLARSLDDMKRWMAAVNLQARHIFQLEHGVTDDYWGQGRRGRFFYRMVEGSVPQWILTHPMTKAPRTGDGLFPGEVIEVTQVLGSDDLTFLRLSNDRGWTYARSPTNGGVLFEDLAGGVSEDNETYSFPASGRGIVPILHGPGLRTQATGVTIQPGECAQASERFTPLDNSNVGFIKLADGRGWVPVKTNVRGPPTVLEGW